MIDGACGTLLQRAEEEALERKYLEGYPRKPESPWVGKLGEKMAQQVWPKETWDEIGIPAASSCLMTPHPARKG
jgi:hypothetical protein